MFSSGSQLKTQRDDTLIKSDARAQLPLCLIGETNRPSVETVDQFGRTDIISLVYLLVSLPEEIVTNGKNG